jgi:hypothetical protein
MAYLTQNSLRPLLPGEESLYRCRRMANTARYGIAVALLALAMPLLAPAQQNVQTPPEEELPAGKMIDGYIVQQAVEFGGRFTDVSGNQQMYDTLINLRDGPRLFGQELIMRSPTRDHGLFDSLYLNSFGFGGDPNDMTRLRVEKGRWYDFVALYRRDHNYFNVNYFANPLSLNQGIGAALKFPTFDPTSMPWFANSPHLQDTARNMGDFNLTLFPDSAIRVRLGYARNDTQGTINTTSSSPLRTLLTESSGWRSDRYQFGIDFRVLRRTTISIDQFYEHDKLDLNFGLNSLPWTVGGGPNAGSPIDIGVLFPPPGCTFASIVAGVTFTGNNVFTPGAGCTNVGLFGWNRTGNLRTDIPTTQLSFASNYFRKLDVTGSGTYSSGHSELLNYQEFINGPGASGQVPSLLTGRTNTDRVSANADLGLTYHFTPAWSASNKFRWFQWRIPGTFDRVGFTCTAAPAFGLTIGTADCTVPAAGTTELFETFLAQRTFENTTKLHWNSRVLGAYVGYRYQRRELTGSPGGDSPTLNSYDELDDTVDRFTTKINEHTALAGVMLRPTPAWRVNGDLELLSADNAFTNIGPRHQQRFRINTVYKVKRWASVNGSVHFIETRNDFATHINSDSTVFPPSNPANPNLFPTTGLNTVNPAYGHKDHWRYFTLGASLNPDPRFSLDFGWTYLDQLIISDTCVPVGAGTVVLPGATAGGTPPALCTPPGGNSVPLTLHYQERTNTGFFVLTFKPVHRVALNFGYEITSTSGHNRWEMAGGANGTGEIQMLSDIFGNSPPLAGNALSPCPSASTPVTDAGGAAIGCAFAGPFPDAPLSQALNWHKPYAGVAVDITKRVTFKGMYAYYGFNEKETSGLPIVNAPRDFHANTGTVSLRYAF